MSELNNRTRRRWSWRNCFAVLKHNKKAKKSSQYSSISPKVNTENDKLPPPSITPPQNESPSDPQEQIEVKTALLPPIETEEQYVPSSLCIIQIESPSSENENAFLHADSIEQVSMDEINFHFTANLCTTHLDAIVEENADDFHQTVETVRLFCDRDIVNDATDLHSRLFDLSQMNHVITQFNENGNLLPDFRRQIDKLRTKTTDIVRIGGQMPRDPELLEARYSTLLSTIESLSVLLKIAQIPACRSLTNRLVFTMEQRMEQLNKFIQLSSTLAIHSSQRRDVNDEDFLSFRSALSSHEHLFTLSS